MRNLRQEGVGGGRLWERRRGFPPEMSRTPPPPTAVRCRRLQVPGRSVAGRGIELMVSGPSLGPVDPGRWVGAGSGSGGTLDIPRGGLLHRRVEAGAAVR